MTWLCLEQADLVGFAAATGDRNALHLDPEFARISAFGRPIAHGVLAAAATLALSGTELTGITGLAIDFDLPVLPGLRYRVRAASEGASLRLGDVRVLAVRWTRGQPAPDPEEPGAPDPPGCLPSGPPRVLDSGQLAALEAESGRYQPDLSGLHHLLVRLTGTSIPARLAEPLAWASYYTGIRTPGRDALLADIRLTVSADGGVPAGGTAAPGDAGLARLAAPAIYQARVSRFDSRTGLVTLSAQLTGRTRAHLTVSAFLRHRIEQPGLGAAGSESGQLAGRTVMVIGGSRGLGAELACGLAGRAATVLAVSSRPAAPELLDRARARRLAIDWVCCDASDVDGLGRVVGGRPLDGLVLAAGPRVIGLPLAPETVAACLAHVEEALRLVLTPLAAASATLREDAFVLFISSSAVTESVTGPQPLWPHYVTAKAAIEGLAGHTARHHPRWRVTVARPPRLRTEMSNSPSSAYRALAPDIAAASILEQMLAAAPAPGEVHLIDGPVFPAATTERAR